MTWLLIYVIAIGLYDLRTRRIPNWVTLPVLLSGLIAHLPGNFDLWLATLALILAWVNEWMGAGDVKLWMAVLWALPVPFSFHALPLTFLVFLITGLIQIIWRFTTKQPLVQIRTPAAWRTIPFLLLCWYVH